MKRVAHQGRSGFTLIELLVVVAVAAILALVAAPSFNEFILKQRLKGVTAQVVTDMQLARTEAASRNQPVWVRFNDNNSTTCYSMYVGASSDCNCAQVPVCTNGATEIRTVAVPRNRGVSLVIPTIPGIDRATEFEFDPSTGGIRMALTDQGGQQPNQFVIDSLIDNARRYRVEVNMSGRPGICKPSGSTMDAVAC
jgi:prepilin-type N-terminal cleavage/methylation domain-containing protein